MTGDELKSGPGEAAGNAASPDSPPTAAGESEAPVGPVTGGDALGAEEGEPGEPGANGAADHERALELDLDELTAKAEKADEYLELAQRTRADFENFRKRAARDAAAAQERGVAKLARELLPAIDNLDRALAAAGEAADEGLVSGVRLVQGDVIAALGRVGVEPFSPEGEPFDPTHHEAVAQQPIEGAEPGTVVEVYQRGYRLGESVLRPARVLVAG